MVIGAAILDSDAPETWRDFPQSKVAIGNCSGLLPSASCQKNNGSS